MKIAWKWRGFYWRIYIAWFEDFMRSEDKSVRRAWWFLWHGVDHRFGEANRCYRLCGLTLHGRKSAPL